MSTFTVELLDFMVAAAKLEYSALAFDMHDNLPF
jgi:hypothetical protein